MIRFRTVITIALLVLSIVAAGTTSYAVPPTISYQGYLESIEEPFTGNATMVYRAFNAPVNGALLWEEEQVVAVDQGLYSVMLGTGLMNGSYGTLEEALLASDDLWLEVQIGGEAEPMSPRQRLASVGFAIRAGSVDAGAITADMMGTAAVTTDKLADGAVTTDKISGGTGSGLDADLLDGQDAASFAPAVHNHDTVYYPKSQVDTLIADLQAQIDVLRGHSCTDGDGDGYYGQENCTTPVDCEDSVAAINPGATELCEDLIDNNCDGQIDEGCVVDNDGDGFDTTVDCDDTNAETYPGAQELCDNLDNDCDGQVDDDCLTYSGLVINELDYDQEGSDTQEFIEILNGSASPVNLDGASLVLVNGSLVEPYLVIDLSPLGALPAWSYAVIGSSSLTVAHGAAFLPFPAGQESIIQNGPDGVQLVFGGNVVDSVAYEGDVPGCTEGVPMAEDFGPGSFGRVGGSDTSDNYTDFSYFQNPTPGAYNH